MTPAARLPREPFWTRAYAWSERAVERQRRRRPWFDHLVRAAGRYRGTQGDLMAAGVTYFAFLGLFPVLLLAASVIGLVLAGDAVLQQELFAAVREAFPGALGSRLVDQLSTVIESAQVAGIIGVAGFLYAGLRTMDKLRVGLERIWKGHVDEPELLRDNVQDVLSLLLLGGIGVVSLGLTGGVTRVTTRFLELVGLADGTGYGTFTWLLGLALAIAVDTAVFLWLLRIVPAVSHPLRRLLPGALFGALGFEVLKLIGGFYLALISDSVTASVFGGAVGLLVWINLVARFAFFTAAWTATCGPVPQEAPQPEDAEPAGQPEQGPEARRPFPLPLAAGLLGTGALLGAAGMRLLPRRRPAR